MSRWSQLLKDNLDSTIRAKQQLLGDAAQMEVFERAIDAVVACYKAGGRLYIAGNGGSAADAQHLATEFVSKLARDRAPLPAEALTTDSSLITAIGNDYGYEHLFARQIEALGKPGDLFIGITTSGNSKNVLKAFDSAAKLGITRIALCGSGGKAKEVAEHALCVPSTHTPRIQECHILIIHILCALLEENLFPEHKAPKPALP